MNVINLHQVISVFVINFPSLCTVVVVTCVIYFDSTLLLSLVRYMVVTLYILCDEI